MLRPRLGRHLEWHGNRIRVVVRVPPALIKKVGVTKLREALTTRDPLEAEREKVDVVRRLKAKLRGEKVAVVQSPLTEEALQWREAARQAQMGKDGPGPTEVNMALHDRTDVIERRHGREMAQAFGSIAQGLATPFTALLDRWFTEKAFSVGYQEDIRRALARLEQWCAETATRAVVEAIQTADAGSFVHDRYIAPKVDVTTANKDISCLHSYWRWMGKRHGIKENPWSAQRLGESKAREAEECSDKRPFTDDEVHTLLGSIRLRREWEFSLFSALSGLRVNEIGALRIKHCTEGKIAVAKSKTPSGVRTIPAHPLLATLIETRSAGKRPDDFLFEELPEQRPNSKRDRAAPVTQAFTRERRRLGVEEKANDEQRQSNIDFHSWRRWFIRRAVAGLEKGGVGYTPWTIAIVVGHKVEDGTIEGVALPLGMTMGVYAGAASWEAMTACVRAVALPKNTPTSRDDLATQAPEGHRPTVRRRELAAAAE